MGIMGIISMIVVGFGFERAVAGEPSSRAATYARASSISCCLRLVAPLLRSRRELGGSMP